MLNVVSLNRILHFLSNPENEPLLSKFKDKNTIHLHKNAFRRWMNAKYLHFFLLFLNLTFSPPVNRISLAITIR